MGFQIGDKVIHWNYGLGEVRQMDEKIIHDRQRDCYIVSCGDLMIWVPIEDSGECSLRSPTPAEEFDQLFEIIKSPSEALPEDRAERRLVLLEELKAGSLATVCRLIRDLRGFGQEKKLNDQERSILLRAKNFFLAEWAYSLSVPLHQAQQEMEALLGS
jgi:RNA polymerase-interacting CarD/CdnL/TRCF family regulator